MTHPSSPASAGLGFMALFSAAIGVIVAQIGMVSSAQGIGIGGSGFIIALGIAYAISLANAFAYAEMSLMLPSQGSLSSFAEAGRWRSHPQRGTPVVAILFVAALPLIGLVWSGGKVEAILPLMIAASVAWLMAYIMAQVSLMVLRARHPELPRPFKVPGYPVVPLLAIAGMVFIIANSSPAPEMTRATVTYTGVVLAVFAVVGALWVKAVMKKDLFEPVKPHLD